MSTRRLIAPARPRLGLHLLSSGHFHAMPEHHAKRGRPMDYLAIWVLGGRGWAREGRQRVTAAAGDLLVFRKGLPHEYGSDAQAPWDIVWAHFDGRAAAETFRALRPGRELRVRLGHDDLLLHRFHELVQAHGPRDPAAAALCDALLCGLLGLMAHRLAHAPGQRAEHLAEMQRLQTYLGQNLRQPLKLATIATAVGVSVPQLNRLARRWFAASPMRYFIRLRMGRAALLLGETNLSVKQVAAAVGYDDPYYFSRLFAKTLGQPPTTYRQRQHLRT